MKIKILGELLSFMWKRKLWWLIPFVLVTVLLGPEGYRLYAEVIWEVIK